MLEFRPLRADEIECRVQGIYEKGVQLLLYKDARCDMNILDETVGPLNWERSHSRENANCIVSIWDSEKKEWIHKEDTGVESNTQAEKGLASDSFKRACFNWGIGRELYTSPFVWIPAKLVTIDTNGNTKRTKDKFSVESIVIEDRKITGLKIKNQKGVTVYSYGKATSENQTTDNAPVGQTANDPVEQVANEVVPKIKIDALRLMFKKHNIDEAKVIKAYKLDKLEDVTEKKYKHMCVKKEALAKECGL